MVFVVGVRYRNTHRWIGPLILIVRMTFVSKIQKTLVSVSAIGALFILIQKAYFMVRVCNFRYFMYIWREQKALWFFVYMEVAILGMSLLSF